MINEVTGAALGVLMGLVTGLDLQFLLLIASRVFKADKTASAKEVAAVTTQLLAIPTFWFGGPWLTHFLVQNIDPRQAVPYYVIALAIVFGMISYRGILKLIAYAEAEYKVPAH